jgi:5'-3' exonuclease
MLATIHKNVPIDFNFKKCHWGKYDKKKVARLLKSLEFYSLVKRLP